MSINLLKVAGGIMLFWGAEGAFHFYRRRREDPNGTAMTEWWDFLTNRELTIPYVSSLLGHWLLLVLGAAILYLDVPLVFKLDQAKQVFEYDWAANATFFYVVAPIMGVWLIAADNLSLRMHHPILPEVAARFAGGLIRLGLVILWLIYVVDAFVALRSAGWELAVGALLLMCAASWLASGWIGSLWFWERHEVHRLNAHDYPLCYATTVFLCMILGAVLLRGQPYGDGQDARPLGAPAAPMKAKAAELRDGRT